MKGEEEEVKRGMEEYLEAVKGELDLLGMTPLTEGGEYPWSEEMVDRQLFLQNQIDIMEEELEDMDDEDEDFFRSESPG